MLHGELEIHPMLLNCDKDHQGTLKYFSESLSLLIQNIVTQVKWIFWYRKYAKSGENETIHAS